MEIPILYEDESLVVVNKPAGIVVNRSETVEAETLQDWVEKELRLLDGKKDVEGEFLRRSGCVHRLDKATSGALIIAKNAPAFRLLQLEFKERRVAKNYRALVHGKPPDVAGEIHVPIGRLRLNRERFGVVAHGRDAITRYRIVQRYRSNSGDELSLLSLAILTGRTHQIRVHLKYLGHPIVSDELYLSKKRLAKDHSFCPRLFLHAQSISFTHPGSGETCTVDAPLAPDLASVLKRLQPY